MLSRSLTGGAGRCCVRDFRKLCHRSTTFLGAVCASLALAIPFAGAHAAAPPARSGLEPQGLFERNLGQYAPDVLYRGRFSSMDAALHADGSVSIYPRRTKSVDEPVRISALEARNVAQPGASEPADFRTHYFRGGAGNRRIADVPHFSRLTYPSVYPGIDLVYHSRGGKLEFDFVVAPGADPATIRLRADNASAVRIDEQGDLAIESGNAVVFNRRPVAYQVRDGNRIPVECAYVLAEDRTITLALGAYDHAAEVVIDPVVDYSSYLGGSSDDYVNGVRLGVDGYIYVTGTTMSSNFPIANALDSTQSGSSDAFVAKINPATGRAVWATFLGGGDGDGGAGIAVDASSNVYVTGSGGSRFPTTTGAYRTSGTGSLGFVTKIAPAGNALLYSTFVPGTSPAKIEVDGAGQAVITGSAGSAFSTSAGAFQVTYAGYNGTSNATSGDAFALKLNAAGSNVVFATFFGGNGGESAAGLAIDSAGRVAIAGNTNSTNLPLASAYQGTLRGTSDGFLAILSANGTSLVSSTYFGGTNIDDITGLAADPYGNVIVAGKTESTDFPLLNARMPTLVHRYSSPEKGFLAKFVASPLQLVFSTYTGSSSDCCDTAFAVAADQAGDIYIAGSVSVAEFSYFQSVNPFLTTAYVSALFGGADARQALYVAGYSRDGQALRYQTIIAPCRSAQDCFQATIAAGKAGQMVVGASTDVQWLPISALNTKAKYDGTNSFTLDGWVTTFTTEGPLLQLGTSVFTGNSANPVTLVATSFGAGTSGSVTFWDGTTSLGSAPLVEGVARFDATFVPGVRRLTATLGANTSPLRLFPVSPAVGSCQ